MSHLKCPLCGRGVALSHFDPSDYDLDVYAFSVRGLGRGRGFEKTEEFSILNSDSETMALIKNRILELSKLFIDHNQLAETEVLRALNIVTVPPEILEKRDRIIEDFTEKTVDLQGEISVLKKNLSRKDGVIGDLSEETVTLQSTIEDLEGQVEHRTDQARKLRQIARNQKETIGVLEEQIEDLSEEMID